MILPDDDRKDAVVLDECLPKFHDAIRHGSSAYPIVNIGKLIDHHDDVILLLRRFQNAADAFERIVEVQLRALLRFQEPIRIYFHAGSFQHLLQARMPAADFMPQAIQNRIEEFRNVIPRQIFFADAPDIDDDIPLRIQLPQALLQMVEEGRFPRPCLPVKRQAASLQDSAGRIADLADDILDILFPAVKHRRIFYFRAVPIRLKRVFDGLEYRFAVKRDREHRFQCAVLKLRHILLVLVLDRDLGRERLVLYDLRRYPEFKNLFLRLAVARQQPFGQLLVLHDIGVIAPNPDGYIVRRLDIVLVRKGDGHAHQKILFIDGAVSRQAHGNIRLGIAVELFGFRDDLSLQLRQSWQERFITERRGILTDFLLKMPAGLVRFAEHLRLVIEIGYLIVTQQGGEDLPQIRDIGGIRIPQIRQVPIVVKLFIPFLQLSDRKHIVHHIFQHVRKRPAHLVIDLCRLVPQLRERFGMDRIGNRFRNDSRYDIQNAAELRMVLDFLQDKILCPGIIRCQLQHARRKLFDRCTNIGLKGLVDIHLERLVNLLGIPQGIKQLAAFLPNFRFGIKIGLDVTNGRERPASISVLYILRHGIRFEKAIPRRIKIIRKIVAKEPVIAVKIRSYRNISLILFFIKERRLFDFLPRIQDLAHEFGHDKIVIASNPFIYTRFHLYKDYRFNNPAAFSLLSYENAFFYHFLFLQFVFKAQPFDFL